MTRQLPDKPRTPFYFSLPMAHMFVARQGWRASSVQSNLPLLFDTFVLWFFGRNVLATIYALQKAGDRTVLHPRLILGIIAAGNAWQEVINLCIAMAGHRAETVIVLDMPDAATAVKPENAVRAAQPASYDMRSCVIAHSLGQDFATQRNRIQQTSRSKWMLQSNCNEPLSEKAKNVLLGIMDYAEHEAWHAVAFARCNLVDGEVSALYPDVQCQLLRRSVRFTRAVHEYPTFVHPGVPIFHTIDSARLTRREVVYKRIHEGAGRPHGTVLLRMKLPLDVELAA